MLTTRVLCWGRARTGLRVVKLAVAGRYTALADPHFMAMIDIVSLFASVGETTSLSKKLRVQYEGAGLMIWSCLTD